MRIPAGRSPRPLEPARAAVMASFLVALSIAAAGQAGAGVMRDPDLGLEVEWEDSWSEVGSAYHPVGILIRNRSVTRTILVTAAQEQGYGFSQAGVSEAASTALVTVPPGETEIELPVLRTGTGYAEVTFDVDGRRDPQLTIVGGGGYGAQMATIVVMGGTAGSSSDRLVDLFVQAGDSSILAAVWVPLGAAPSTWQSYAGLPGLVSISTEDATALGSAERAALGRWVKLGGGALWLHGEDHAAALDALGLFAGSVERSGEVVSLGCMTGAVLLSAPIEEVVGGWLERLGGGSAAAPEEPAEATPAAAPEEATPAAPAVPRGYGALKEAVTGSFARSSLLNAEARSAVLGYAPGGESGYQASVTGRLDGLLDGLHEIPRAGYCLISILLALLIGPVNLLLLASRRRLALFYLTAPLVAILGMAGLLAYTLLDQGIHLRVSRVAVLVHDPVGGEGAVILAQGTFGGIAGAPGPVLPVETAAVPFASSDASGSGGVRLVTDWTSAQRLSSGWISSRRLRGLITVTPARVRMGLHLVRIGGKVFVENGLTAALIRVVVRLPPDDPLAGKGRIYSAGEEVQPGGRVELHRSADDIAVPLLPVASVDWTILAEAEGLPHIGDQALRGEIVEEGFYYVAVSHLERPDLALAEGSDGGAP